jgi:REP element-mobilizing transposase RayT
VSITDAPGVTAVSEPLPEIDFKLPWEMEETAAEVVSETTSVQSVEPVAEPVLESVTEQPGPSVLHSEPVPASIPEPTIEHPIPPATPSEPAAIPAPEQVAEQPLPPPIPVVEVPIEALQPAASSFAEVLNAVAPQSENSPAPIMAQPVVESVTPEIPALVEVEESPAPPPTLKDFRFNYTCVLLPGDREQFLARDLSEKLSSTMPDIHEDQGWHMTSITIRPQYLLWSVAVPMGVCPNKVIHEVRNLTSNLIFAKFPEIASKKTSNDFWSSKYLAVSGSEPPPANLIFEFVANAWKNPEPGAP